RRDAGGSRSSQRRARVNKFVPATQADREAGADAYYVICHVGQVQHIIDGMEDEIYLVQSFAKHRIAVLKEAARVAESYNCWDYVQGIGEGRWEPGSPYDRGQQNAAQKIASAIRALAAQAIEARR